MLGNCAEISSGLREQRIVRRSLEQNVSNSRHILRASNVRAYPIASIRARFPSFSAAVAGVNI